MDPIDVRADSTFTQALRCVQFRVPQPYGFKAPGFVLALGVRYGMIAMAAAYHLLITADDDEEGAIMEMIDCWPRLVEDSVKWDLSTRLPFAIDSSVPSFIGRIAELPLRAYLPLYRRLCPLYQSLDLVGHSLAHEHRSMIFEGWPWLKRRVASNLFENTWRESAEFALHFFDRRQADLEEVSEIALIGE